MLTDYSVQLDLNACSPKTVFNLSIRFTAGTGGRSQLHNIAEEVRTVLLVYVVHQ